MYGSIARRCLAVGDQSAHSRKVTCIAVSKHRSIIGHYIRVPQPQCQTIMAVDNGEVPYPSEQPVWDVDIEEFTWCRFPGSSVDVASPLSLGRGRCAFTGQDAFVMWLMRESLRSNQTLHACVMCGETFELRQQELLLLLEVMLSSAPTSISSDYRQPQLQPLGILCVRGMCQKQRAFSTFQSLQAHLYLWLFERG